MLLPFLMGCIPEYELSSMEKGAGGADEADGTTATKDVTVDNADSADTGEAAIPPDPPPYPTELVFTECLRFDADNCDSYDTDCQTPTENDRKNLEAEINNSLALDGYVNEDGTPMTLDDLKARKLSLTVRSQVQHVPFSTLSDLNDSRHTALYLTQITWGEEPRTELGQDNHSYSFPVLQCLSRVEQTPTTYIDSGETENGVSLKKDTLVAFHPEGTYVPSFDELANNPESFSEWSLLDGIVSSYSNEVPYMGAFVDQNIDGNTNLYVDATEADNSHVWTNSNQLDDSFEGCGPHEGEPSCDFMRMGDIDECQSDWNGISTLALLLNGASLLSSEFTSESFFYQEAD